jgi:hypothetical protein
MATKKPSGNDADTKADTKTSRKGRVLHTRVPAVLEEELKAAAKNLRIPVSNLVRTILEDAVAATLAVGKVAEDELIGAAQRIHKERDRWGHAAKAAGTSAARRAEAEVEADTEGADEASADLVTSGGADEGTVESDAAPSEPDDTQESKPAPLAGVLGFQPFVLAIETRCGNCDQRLMPGADAFLGIHSEPGVRVIVGPECVPGRSES